MIAWKRVVLGEVYGKIGFGSWLEIKKIIKTGQQSKGEQFEFEETLPLKTWGFRKWSLFVAIH